MRSEPLLKAIQRSLTVIGIAAVLYHMIMVQWQLQGSTDHYITHVAFIMVIGGLAVLPDALKNWDDWRGKVKFLLAALSVIAALVSMGYYYVNGEELETAQPFITDMDMFITGVAVTALVVLCWIHWGGLITSITVLAIAYFFWGHLIPGDMGHPEYELNFIMSYLGGSLTLGMFGPIIQVSANVIFLFVIFGSLFKYTGVLPLFLELGKTIGNLVRGGAAFPAVIGSGFVGTVTGAAVANVILTGSVTIPMMKRTGFKPEHAAAVESVASTGGQIMPPIMGSAAFLMATFLEVPYVVIMQMAFIPALLYYVGAGVGVFFMIRAAGLDPPRMAVDNKLILRTLPVFVVPMAVVVWLLFLYYSPGFAAFCGILLLVGIAVLQKETRPDRSQWIEAFTEAAKIGAQLSLILALVGILAQVALTTNLATKISSTIIGVVGVELVPILLISAFTAIVLGMGLPTPVAYVIMFVTVVPLMIDAGVEQFAANFFAFYFAILSTLTPPVALSVLAAAQLAGCSFMQAAAHSLRLSIVGYLLPFTMVFTPAILGFPDKVGLDGLLAIGVLVLASIAGGAALYGYFLRPLGPLDRIVQGAAALAGLFYVFSPNQMVLAVFFILLTAGAARPVYLQAMDRRRLQAAPVQVGRGEPPG
jgi:TRAP transporter 4TM/12TM fusion protein